MLKLLLVFCGIFCYFNSIRANSQLTPSEFLRSSKEHYQNIISSNPNRPQNLQEIHFVMGNESADLDSIVSSITYAYLLHHEKPNEFYVPLLNIFREEIALRKDILHLFQQLGISSDDLLFLDDQVPLDDLFAQDKLRFTLVDHNILRPRQEHLSDAVERIVDHHADENKQYPLLTEENKTIAIVGSATTLVAEKIFSSSQIAMSSELATLLIGPILIDTANLQSEEKTTERDTNAVQLLQSLAPDLPPNFYEELLEAKNDVSGLTPAMLLSKDFKEYLDGKLLYGISSLPATICWGTEDLPSIQPVLEKYAKERDLAFLIILMNNNDPQGPKRKIMVYSPSERLIKAFDAYVQNDSALNQVLLVDPNSNDQQTHIYYAEKFIARKQLQPLFHFSQNPELIAIFEEEMGSSLLSRASK